MLYDIVVEAQFEDEVVAPFVEHVQCLVPGPPDNPVIWLRAIESNEFVIEWAEPRLYGFKCAGYQVYRLALGDRVLNVSPRST